LAKIFNDVGLPVILKDLQALNAARLRRQYLELWFGQAKLPASCGGLRLAFFCN
jgi:hypothetical protein